MTLLEEENAILKAKCKKVNELEDKVDTILKQNSQLLGENERLSKSLHQKKSEYEMLREKYEVQQTQKSSYLQEFEYEKKKLLKEIDSLEGEIHEVERAKNAQIQ